MFERAFEEVIISDEEWSMVHQTMAMTLQKAGGGPGEGGQQPPQGNGDTQALTDEEMMAQTAERIGKLPPAAKAKLEEMVNGGMPPADALKKIEAELQPQ
jgi:hypothetical protein